MSEWWTYRPSDFLMYSASSWGRLVEMYNRDTWPLALLMLALGIALAWAITRHPRTLARPAALVLAGVWLWVGWGFHWSRHAQINTAGPWLAWAFALQAAVLASLASLVTAGGREGVGLLPVFPRAGTTLVLVGVLLWPLIAPLSGHGWAQAEVFGMMPEPTALATLGFLLATGLRHRAWAMPTPLLSLAAGLMTMRLLWTRG